MVVLEKEVNQFIELNQLQEATGYKRYADICKWLENNVIAYRVAKDGRPVVSWMDYHGHVNYEQEPDFTQVA